MRGKGRWEVKEHFGKNGAEMLSRDGTAVVLSGKGLRWRGNGEASSV